MEHGNIILSGFGIVIGVLALLWAATAVITKVFTQTTKAKKEDTAPASATMAAVAVPAAPTSGVPEHHLAAITAAVAASFAAPHRVVSASGPYAHVSAWTQQGLFEHFASHRTMWGSRGRTKKTIKS